MCMLHIMLAVAQWFYKRGNPLPFKHARCQHEPISPWYLLSVYKHFSKCYCLWKTTGSSARSSLRALKQTPNKTLHTCVCCACVFQCTYCKRNWGEGWHRLLLLDPIQPEGHGGEIGLRHVSCLVSTFCSLCLNVFSLRIFWRSWRSFPLLVYFSSSPQTPRKGEPCTDGTTVVHLRRASQWWISTKKQVLKDSGKAQISLHVLV